MNRDGLQGTLDHSVFKFERESSFLLFDGRFYSVLMLQSTERFFMI